MSNTNLLVNQIEITKEAIIFSGIDVDSLILNEDLYRDIAEEPVKKFSFDRTNEGHMKYLAKLTFNSRYSRQATSFGAKIEALKHQYILFNDNFRVAE